MDRCGTRRYFPSCLTGTAIAHVPWNNERSGDHFGSMAPARKKTEAVRNLAMEQTVLGK